MNKPSSTITAAAISGATAAFAFGLLSIFGPEYYKLVPPGMEAGAAVLIGAVIGYLKTETVLIIKKG